MVDVDDRTDTPKMVLPKRKRPPPSGSTGPPAIPRAVRARLAALESLKGMSLGNAAEAYNVPKSTVADQVARLKAGPLPDACLTPTPVIMDASKFLVKAGDWKDPG